MFKWVSDKFTKKEVVVQQKPAEVEKELPFIVFIHGAGCTSKSWNYIIEKLQPERYIALEYSIDESFNVNLSKMAHAFGHIHDKKIFIVSHSMGGIYALNLYQMFRHRVVGALSMSTPYGGSRTADFVKYLYPSYVLFKDVGVKSKPILRCHNITLHIPWTQIVTTVGGVPWHNGANDGVVTLASQRHRDDMDYIEVEVSHHEVLVSSYVVDIIREKINSETA